MAIPTVVALSANLPAGGAPGLFYAVDVSKIYYWNNADWLSVGPGPAGALTAIKISGGTLSAQRSDITFANSNGVSFGFNTNGVLTGTVATNYQSAGAYLTTAALSGDSSKYAGINGAITGGSITVNTSGISVNLPAYLTTAALSAGTSNYAGVGETVGTVAGTDLAMTVNTDGVSIAYPKWITTAQAPGAYLTTARASNDAVGLNTALTANGVAWTVNSAGLSLNVPAFLTTAMQSASSSVFAKTGFTTTTIAGTAVAGTLTTDGLLLAVPAYLTTAQAPGAYLTTAALSNHSHGNPTLALTNLSGTTASASNGFTLSLSAGAGGPGGGGTYSYYSNLPAINTVTFSFAQSTSHIFPLELEQNYSFACMRVVVSGSVAASSTQATTGNVVHSMSGMTSHNVVIYSRGTNGNSMSLQSLTSTQVVDQCLFTRSFAATNSSQYSVSLRFTLGTYSVTKDYSSSVTRQDWHTSHLTDLTGARYLDIPLGVSLAPGQYWIAYGRSTTAATQNASISVATRLLVSHNSMVAVSQNTLAIGMIGGNTNSSVGWAPGHGSFSTAGGGTTASIPLSAVSTTASNNEIYLQLFRIV